MAISNDNQTDVSITVPVSVTFKEVCQFAEYMRLSAWWASLGRPEQDRIKTMMNQEAEVVAKAVASRARSSQKSTRNRAYWEANKEKINAERRAAREADKEKIRKYEAQEAAKLRRKEARLRREAEENDCYFYEVV